MKTMDPVRLEILVDMARSLVETAEEYGLRASDDNVPPGMVRVPKELLAKVERSHSALRNLHNVFEPCIDGEYMDNMREALSVFPWLIEVLKGEDQKVGDQKGENDGR